MCEMHDTPRCNRPSGIYILTRFSEKTSLSWLLFHQVFSCVHLYRNETFENLLHIALARRTKRFTLFCARSITRRFLLSMAMFIFRIAYLYISVLKIAATFTKRTTALATAFLETLSSNDVRYRKQNIMDPPAKKNYRGQSVSNNVVANCGFCYASNIMCDKFLLKFVAKFQR